MKKRTGEVFQGLLSGLKSMNINPFSRPKKILIKNTVNV